MNRRLHRPARPARLISALALIALTVGALVAAAPAAAAVYVEGTGEPAFTRSTTNTQWVRWEGSPSYSTYKLEFDHYADAVLTKTQATGPMTANGAGTTWVGWGGVLETLAEGKTYGICAYGRYTIDGVGSRDTGSCHDANQNNKRAATTIDLTKPSIAVSIDEGAAWSRTGKLAYRIDYNDNLAFPFPANFICRDVGTDPAQACATATHQYNEACSVAVGGMKKTTHFACNEDLSGPSVNDGPVTLCVVSADAAVPDNPYGTNQSASASQANLSSRTCDSITLDRTAPAVSVQTSTATAVAGDALAFTAQASDATSGLTGAYSWNWGDGTPAGSGAAPGHTFAAPGTYDVQVKTKDNAGNETTVTKVVTVAARPTSASTGTDSSTRASALPASTPASPQPVGGQANAAASTAALDVAAPTRIRLARKPKPLTLALTAAGPGRAQIALQRGGRVHATGTATVTGAGTLSYALKLPRGLRSGSYALKVVWMPAGATTAKITTLKLTMTAPSRARRARTKARAATQAPLVAAEGAPVAVPTGEAPDAGTSRTVRLPLG